MLRHRERPRARRSLEADPGPVQEVGPGSVQTSAKRRAKAPGPDMRRKEVILARGSCQEGAGQVGAPSPPRSCGPRRTTHRGYGARSSTGLVRTGPDRSGPAPRRRSRLAPWNRLAAGTAPPPKLRHPRDGVTPGTAWPLGWRGFRDGVVTGAVCPAEPRHHRNGVAALEQPGGVPGRCVRWVSRGGGVRSRSQARSAVLRPGPCASWGCCEEPEVFSAGQAGEEVVPEPPPCFLRRSLKSRIRWGYPVIWTS